jgi:hypothetical protein
MKDEEGRKLDGRWFMGGLATGDWGLEMMDVKNVHLTPHIALNSNPLIRTAAY